jgi:hypothetical protein
MGVKTWFQRLLFQIPHLCRYALVLHLRAAQVGSQTRLSSDYLPIVYPVLLRA